MLAIRTFFLHRVQITFIEQVQSLNSSDIKIHYDTIYASWVRNILTVENLVISKNTYDTTCTYPEFISAARLQMKGLGLLSLLFHNELTIRELRIDRPHAMLRSHSTLLASSAARNSKGFESYAETIMLDSLTIEVLDSGTCNLKSRLRTSIEVRDLNVRTNPARPFDISFSQLHVTGAVYDLPASFYSWKSKDILIDLPAHTMKADSIYIIPSFSKSEFGKRAGFDIDRIEGVIPFVKLRHLNVQYNDTLAVDASAAEIQMFLHVFHDKRLPHRQRNVPLPIDQMRKLSFGLNIDTVLVRKSFIEYEEIAPEAEEAGKVFFDNLAAKILNVTNDFVRDEGKTLMEAKADFMGQGKVHVKTVFPWKHELACRLEGAMDGLSFSRVNEMVEPAANLRFETGKLNRINFNFTYNGARSDGKVTLNYEDLRIVSLKNDDDNDNRRKGMESEKDNFKTFLINAFVVRKNLDEKVATDKRTGDISWERDRTRSIFNYWWKSLFTGIKSAFNLDKIEMRLTKKKERHKKAG